MVSKMFETVHGTKPIRFDLFLVDSFSFFYSDDDDVYTFLNQYCIAMKFKRQMANKKPTTNFNFN